MLVKSENSEIFRWVDPRQGVFAVCLACDIPNFLLRYYVIKMQIINCSINISRFCDVRGLIMPAKKRVLFVCIHNSARSQMAEAFLNNLGGELFEAESAGFEPGNINPLAVEVMRE